jgi:hypothetical protein
MENTTTKSGEETETEIVSSSVTEPEMSDVPEELLELDDEEDGGEAAGSGVVSGAFGLTSLGLAVASLSGSWLGNVYGTRAQYFADLHAKTAASQVQSTQNSLDAFASGWHGQAVIGGIFALAALLFGAGVLASPSLLLSGKTPAWARGAALAGIIVGAIGLLLAILAFYGLLAPKLTA